MTALLWGLWVVFPAKWIRRQSCCQGIAEVSLQQSHCYSYWNFPWLTAYVLSPSCIICCRSVGTDAAAGKETVGLSSCMHNRH